MPEHENTNGDTSKSDNQNNSTSHATVRANSTGLRWIIIAGCIALLALLTISIYLPYLTERVKFFTANALSLVVLLAIAVQVKINQRQWEAMVKQLDVMNEQARFMSQTLAQNERAVAIAEMSAQTAKQALYISERPYVEVVEVTVSLPFMAETPIVYSIKVDNKGRTPAYELYGAMYIDVREDPLPENPEYRPLRTGISKVTLGSGVAMLTKQTTNFVLPQDVIDGIYAGKWFVYVYGLETYKDGLTSDIHRTRYCYLFNAEENHFVASPYHNDSD